MKKLFSVILCLIIVFSFAACAAKSNDSASTYEVLGETGFGFSEENSTADSAEPSSAETTAQAQEKIIKTVYLDIQTKTFSTYVDALTASVSALGGYIESSDTYFGSDSSSNRRANFKLRIPAEKLDEFIEKADENGKITNKSEETQNVTLEYVDLESRISAYKTERETLTSLLEKAESLENVLAIQERLSQVNYEIESYTSQLRVLENRVSFATVNAYVSEVERVSSEETTVFAQIKNRFLENLDNLGNVLRSALIELVGGLPVIVPVALVAFAVILIIRKLIKKRRAKKNSMI